MITDFHQHPYAGVHEYMLQNHVTVTVLLPGSDEGNETVVKWAKKWPGQFVPFYYCTDLSDPAKCAADIESAVERDGIKGIKFQPLRQRFYPNEARPIVA